MSGAPTGFHQWLEGSKGRNQVPFVTASAFDMDDDIAFGGWGTVRL